MNERTITCTQLDAFCQNLTQDEKSTATVEKYLRDVRAFAVFLGGEPVSKEAVIAYKKHLVERGYAVRSCNSMIASVNSFLSFIGHGDCRVKAFKLQQQAYCDAGKELTKGEYLRLLEAAAANPKLQLVMQTICATGIRVSELQHFTVEAVKCGEVNVNCKGKTRRILIPSKLRKTLLAYARGEKIRSGAIFTGRNGKSMNRSSIWAQMKQLCRMAGVEPGKVFPHNLRKLFARTFYGIEKDIAKLADILGHSSINTTRIYIVSTGSEHRRKIERLGLLI